jgi:hypothetical protein
MKTIFKILFIFCQFSALYAQQWKDKKYYYDSTLNVVYGTAVNFNGGIDTLKMDIYTPICDDKAHIANRPLLIWIHGGAFLAGDKSESNITNLCKQFAKRGYVTASINYRLGFISDEFAWNCNYPNYSCIFATDSAEWYRAYLRAIQDGKGALRYLVNRHKTFRIDTGNIFLAGESAGAFTALGIGLMDTASEKPIQANKINDAIRPNTNTASCSYNSGKSFPNTYIPRPDLGSIEGNLEPSTIHYTIKGIGNMYGAMLNNLLRQHKSNTPKPGIFSYHQPCDIVVPIDSGRVFAGLSWCMANGYGCYAIANSAKLYGSRTISQWNSKYNYGYNIHNEFTSTNFPYSFLIGKGSCSDQINNPCHAYDNFTLRADNLATFFADLVSTSPICDTTFFPSSLSNTFSKNKINLYPNPAQTSITIEQLSASPVNVSIYNNMGQIMLNNTTLTEKKTTLDIRFLPAGIYSVFIQDLNGVTQVMKLVRE